MSEERKAEAASPRSGVPTDPHSGVPTGPQNGVPTESVSVGSVVDCVVEQIMPYGAFVRLTGSGRRGMIHISELSINFVKKVEDVLSLQQNIKAKVIKIDEKGRIDLSLKKAEEQPFIRQAPLSRDERDSFERKMASFLKTSEAKLADLSNKSGGNPRRRRPSGGGGYPKG